MIASNVFWFRYINWKISLILSFLPLTQPPSLYPILSNCSWCSQHLAGRGNRHSYNILAAHNVWKPIQHQTTIKTRTIPLDICKFLKKVVFSFSNIDSCQFFFEWCFFFQHQMLESKNEKGNAIFYT